MRRAALSALIALLAVAAPAAARAAGGGARTFERHALAATAQAGGGWRTPVLRAARGFEVVGATWRGGGNAQARLRARRTDGRWTRWAAVDAGEPVWTGAADAVELRGTRPLHALRLRFVAIGRDAAADVPRAVPAADGGRPAIVPRSAWDPHGACRPRVQARYGRVDFALVHHTETLSPYTPAQSAAIVLGICLFHRDGNGWSDIGYDALIDRFGTVFDGRAGGVDQPVTGAQAGGWNAVSTGVALIGDYSAAPPPARALRMLERVLAWKLSLAGVPAQGVVVERSTGSDPRDNAYPRGALVRFQRISGHRDADLTDCPGAALYALLPRVRRAVAALVAPPRELLTIAPVGAPVEQGPWTLSGRLALASGRRPAGVEVDVQQQAADESWRQLAVTRTGADGIWSAAPPLTRNGPLRAVAPSLAPSPSGEPTPSPAPAAGRAPSPAPAVVSQVVTARVRAGVRLRAAPLHARAGSPLPVTGATTPPKRRVAILVTRRDARGGFGRPRRIAVAPAADGSFAATVRLGRPGIYRVLALTAADALNAAGSSRAALVRVLARR
jgi:N-acetylmuramoyl-L-alanine amidase